MLRAVLFDLDNTLVDRDGAFRQCVYAAFPDPTVRAELLQLDHGGRGDRAALFQSWERHAGTPINQSRFGALLAARIRPDPALLACLRRLALTLKLGVITNGSGETQRQKFQAAGLAEVIPARHVWVSGELGLAKPDPEIFLHACRALGETPAHCLHLGDHEQDDFEGAARAGLRACRVDQVLDAAGLAGLLPGLTPLNH